ncbi:pentachlorophenol monooxygenase [Microtetraspora sp. NBRC 13810]|uniref:FAD-dependent oxidoreductase n=1 Tax=Microtetraspora sp. NBRC 13810 TaxID=3030990 RepID=UPI0024A2085A|nr:FAD-dependent oxidoreductase [Microtetraspora sp. NBRC 13810]GLW07061.1 pentachlorophenol monooxygenase [Microtetraspora sp. NBRC 13810]
MNTNKVLIVGAGPCGLLAAVELSRRGVPVTVVDAGEEPAGGSRAILLWPHALESFDRLGLRAEADKRGVPVEALGCHLAPGTVLRLPADPHHAPLVLPQEDTCDLLEAELRRLGGTVERGLRVTRLATSAESVRATARRADGTEVTLEAGWLIGADGHRSTVRAELGIVFSGTPLPVTFLIAEGRLAGDYDTRAVGYHLSRSGVLLVAPLPGGRARIAGAVPEDTAVTPETVRRLLDERGPGGLDLTETTFAASFTSGERVANTFRAGRCFLVGDAAHVHAPTGGQGLNLGLEDVRNLVWKLTGVIEGRFAPSILQSYDIERRAAAEQTVAATGRLTRAVMMGPAALLVRNSALSLAHRTGLLARLLLPTLAGWRIRYPDVLGLAGPQTLRGLPAPGTRSPAWPLDPDQEDRFQLISMGPADDMMIRRGRALAAQAPGLVVHRHRVTKGSGFVLLRPDGYVAAAGPETDFTRLARELRKLFG